MDIDHSRPLAVRPTVRWHPACLQLIYGLLTSVVALPSGADAIWVVARRDAPVSSLTRDDVADLFLGGSRPAVPLRPIDPMDEALREDFYHSTADMSLKSLRAYWAKQVFTGRGHPPQTLTLEQATQSIARDPNAVTFVRAGNQPANSKILLTIEREGSP